MWIPELAYPTSNNMFVIANDRLLFLDALIFSELSLQVSFCCVQ